MNERDFVYIRLTSTKVLFVVNRVSTHRHTYCVKRRKSLIERAYTKERERQVEPNHKTKFL